jgi:integrase
MEVNVRTQDAAASRTRKVPSGIRERHARDCATHAGKKRCSCSPSFEAVVSFARGERRRKTFPSLSDAKAWRTQLLAAKTRSRQRAPSSITLRDAAAEYVEGMRDGSITTRSGQPYKPSTIRGYEQSLELHALPDLGGRRAADVTTGDIQRLVERLSKERHAGTTIANVINPLRAIYRRLVVLGRVNDNPTRGAVLPISRAKRLHAGDPGDAARVIAAVAEQDRCAWALAFYAGLRLGELRALRWGDIDEKVGVIHVRLSWDVKEGEIDPKSTAGVRDVPILTPLLPHLAAQRAACAWSTDPDGLVLGSSRRGPLGYNGLRGRSTIGFAAAGVKRVTLHEARHSFASYLAASGIGIKDLTVILGHSSVTVSLDRYGHLFEAGKAQTAAQINAWFHAADTERRLAQLKTDA